MIRSIVCGVSWVCSVAKTRWPVSAAVSAVRDRLQVAHLADEDHVGVLAQRGAAARRRRSGASAPSSRWLTMHFLCVWRNSIGSSIVMMCSSRVCVDLVDHRRQRRRLARAGRAGDEHEAARLVAKLVHDRRQAELLDRQDLRRDQAEGGADRRCAGSRR